MTSVNIAEPLAEAANVQAKIAHRNLDEQINYWAKIGKIAEENPDLSFELIKSILDAREQVLLGDVEPYLFD